MPDKTESKTKSRFKKGQSGNPAGRPRGSRNKTTLAVESLLAGEADKLSRKAVELALGGDVTALRLCLDRIAPARRDRPIELPMPDDLCNAEALPKVTAHILQSVSIGEITPSEGEKLAAIVASHARTIELQELESRVSALEAAYENTNTAR